jgi:hypothetical protein
MNLDAPARNLQSIKGKHAHQPAEVCDIPYHKNVFPLLNHCGWEQLMFKSVGIYKIFVQCYRVQQGVEFVMLKRRFLRLCVYNIYSVYVQ